VSFFVTRQAARRRFAAVPAIFPAFLLALMSLMLAACSGQAKEVPLPRGAVVLVIGDSITAGYGLGADKSWAATLVAETGWQVINAGVSGDTTAGGLERLPALLDEHKPKAVIVELGGNDMLRRHGSTETVANIEAMLEAIRRTGARPILMATPQPSIAGAVFAKLSDAPFYAEIAERQSVPLIADVLARILSTSELKLDQIHPNAEGHRQLGVAAAKALRKLGLV
jgi:acyl-CoA thioesterase-1